MRVDVVHGNTSAADLLSVNDLEHRLVVGCCTRAFMIVDVETAQGELEWQVRNLHACGCRRFVVFVGRLAKSQMDNALTRGEVRQQGSGQNDDERCVEQDQRPSAHASANDVSHAEGCQQSP